MHRDLADKRINGLLSNLNQLDDIRTTKDQWPTSPNITFWLSSYDAVLGDWSGAHKKTSNRFPLLSGLHFRAIDIDASLVQRYCADSYFLMKLEKYRESRESVFKAIALADDNIGKNESHFSAIKKHFFTNDATSQPTALAHLSACDLFIREGSWIRDAEREEYFNFHWQSFNRIGGFDVISPPVLISVLSDQTWYKRRPDIMPELSYKLFLKVSDGFRGRLWRRTNLLFASILAIRAGERNAPIDVKFALYIAIAVGIAAMYGAAAGFFGGTTPDLVGAMDYVRGMTAEALSSLFNINLEIAPSGEELVGSLESMGVDFAASAEVAEIGPGAETTSELTAWVTDLSSLQLDVNEIFSNGETSDRLT